MKLDYYKIAILENNIDKEIEILKQITKYIDFNMHQYLFQRNVIYDLEIYYTEKLAPLFRSVVDILNKRKRIIKIIWKETQHESI